MQLRTTVDLIMSAAFAFMSDSNMIIILLQWSIFITLQMNQTTEWLWSRRSRQWYKIRTQQTELFFYRKTLNWKTCNIPKIKIYFPFTINKTKSIKRFLCTQQCYFFCNLIWYNISNKFYFLFGRWVLSIWQKTHQIM